MIPNNSTRSRVRLVHGTEEGNRNGGGGGVGEVGTTYADFKKKLQEASDEGSSSSSRNGGRDAAIPRANLTSKRNRLVTQHASWLRGYRVQRKLGAGAFSRVYLASHAILDGAHVAVKVLDTCAWDARTAQLLNQEVRTMAMCHHPNVLKLYQTIETPTRQAMIMEYAAGGGLEDYVTRYGALCSQCASLLFAQIHAGLHYMHSTTCIAHRDIKADNVLLTGKGVPKIGDFGFSVVLATPMQLRRTFCGSPAYAAPELLTGVPYDAKAVDMWALGILLHFMLTAHYPFGGNSLVELVRAVTKTAYEPPREAVAACAINGGRSGCVGQGGNGGGNGGSGRGGDEKWVKKGTIKQNKNEHKQTTANTIDMSDEAKDVYSEMLLISSSTSPGSCAVLLCGLLERDPEQRWGHSRVLGAKWVQAAGLRVGPLCDTHLVGDVSVSKAVAEAVAISTSEPEPATTSPLTAAANYNSGDIAVATHHSNSDVFELKKKTFWARLEVMGLPLKQAAQDPTLDEMHSAVGGLLRLALHRHQNDAAIKSDKLGRRTFDIKSGCCSYKINATDDTLGNTVAAGGGKSASLSSPKWNALRRPRFLRRHRLPQQSRARYSSKAILPHPSSRMCTLM